MPAHFAIELDTTPPAVDWGEPWIDGSRLRVPYALDEPEALEAVLSAASGDYPMTIEDDELVLDLPPEERPQPGRTAEIQLHVQDDVWNEALYVLSGAWVRRIVRSIAHRAIVRFVAHRAFVRWRS